jgi:hypothetical protein
MPVAGSGIAALTRGKLLQRLADKLRDTDLTLARNAFDLA